MEHVLHVAAAARTVARKMKLNEDLAEAIGLAHDLGHAPFGHVGERILTDIIKGNHRDISQNKDINGFRQDLKKLQKVIPEFHHEVYGLRVVDVLAKLDREPPGLNLTWAVRDGIVSHCGEKLGEDKIAPCRAAKNLMRIKILKDAGLPCTIEGCIVRMLDRIVYAGRDLEDAIATKIVKESKIPPAIKKALGRNNGEIIGTFIEDILAQSHAPVFVALSKQKGKLMKALLDFNYENIYHSSSAQMYEKQARRTLDLLFQNLWQVLDLTKRFTNGYNQLTLPGTNTQPRVYEVFRDFVIKDMKDIYRNNDPNSLIVLDFIAGMTDNFAVQSFQELFVPQATV
jgi:dGTPase